MEVVTLGFGESHRAEGLEFYGLGLKLFRV